MILVTKILVWLAVAAVVILAILLPIVIVTGMFGGQPVAGAIGFAGLVVLAIGVAWYVRHHGKPP